MTDDLTLDDALLWLNDRLGKSVAVSVAIERGDLDVGVLYADRELHHWTETNRPPPQHMGDIARAHNVGLYSVGAAVLDLTHVALLRSVLGRATPTT